MPWAIDNAGGSHEVRTTVGQVKAWTREGTREVSKSMSRESEPSQTQPIACMVPRGQLLLALGAVAFVVPASLTGPVARKKSQSYIRSNDSRGFSTFDSA